MRDVKNRRYRFEDVEIDVQNLRVTVGSQIRPLEPKSFRLLLFLVESAGRVLPKEEIMAAVWPDISVSDNSLNRAVTQIRKALDDDPKAPRYIETIPTVGYRFVADFKAEQDFPAACDSRDGGYADGVAYVPATAPARVRRYGWAAIAGAATVVIGLGVGGWLFYRLWRAAQPISHPLTRLSLDLPDFALTPDPALGTMLAISADGTRVVYTGRGADGTGRLYSRSLDQEQAMPLPGTEGAYGPFFSPDGQAVGFFAAGELKKVSLDRLGVVVLCAAQKGAAGGSWGDDGNIIAALGNGILSRIPTRGGTVQPVTELRGERKDLAHLWPQVLPGSQSVLFTALATHGYLVDATIEMQSLRSGERTTLVRGGYYGRYVSSGHLLFAQPGTLFAVPMNLKRPALSAQAVPVARDLAESSTSGFAQFDFSSNGTLIFVRGKRERQQLVWLEPNGATQPLHVPAGDYNPAVRLSPDGKRLAIAPIGNDSVDVWIHELERGSATRLTYNGLAWFPVWTPDAKHIAFMSGMDASNSYAPNLYYMRSDGVGQPVRLTTSNNRQVPYSFSPDGKHLAFFEFNPHTKGDIWTLTLDDPGSDYPKVGKPEAFLATPFDERAPMISPDGRWMAYESDETGRNEVYVRSFPGPGGKWQISTDGGGRPVWSKKGSELFYRSSEGMMVASYTVNGEAFAAGKPRLWAARKDLGTYFDLAPDGKRFAVLQPTGPDQTGSEHVVILQNFFDELRRRAPDGK